VAGTVRRTVSTFIGAIMYYAITRSRDGDASSTTSNCSNDGAGAPTTSYVVALAHEQEEFATAAPTNDPPLLF